MAHEKGPKPRLDHFGQEGAHLGQLLEDRDKVNAGRIKTGISFLDDALGGVYPRDIFLVGAGSGVGKTSLAADIALAGAAAGKKVYAFFLEAFKGEISFRLYYKELGRLANEPRLDFSAWIRGEWSHLDKLHGEQIKRNLAGKFTNLLTHYKTSRFTHMDLKDRLEAIKGKADMVVLDHLHVVDTYKAEDENSTQSRTINLLSNMANGMDIPVIVFSHIKKRQSHNYKNAMPKLDDLHGSSELYKVATQVVMLGRDWESESSAPHKAPTLINIEKDRKGRKVPYTARLEYDLSAGRYDSFYKLGRIKEAQWEPIDRQYYPYWAQR